MNNKWLLFKFLLFFILRPPFPCCWVMDFLKYGSVQRYFCSVTLNIKNSLVSIIIAWSIYFLIPVSLKSPPPLPSSPVMLAVPAAGGRRSWIWCTLSPSIFLASLPPLLGREGGRRKVMLSSSNYGQGDSLLFLLLMTLIPLCKQTHRDLSG